MCLDSSPCDANTRLFKWHHIAMFDRHCRRRRHTHRRSFWKKSLKSQPTLRGEDTFLPTSKVTSYPVVRRRWISKLDSKQKTFLIWSLSLSLDDRLPKAVQLIRHDTDSWNYFSVNQQRIDLTSGSDCVRFGVVMGSKPCTGVYEQTQNKEKIKVKGGHSESEGCEFRSWIYIYHICSL